MSVHETTIVSAIDARAATIAQLSRKIHANPELRFEEKQASAWLADAVEQAGVPVERGVGGLPTAFRARIGRLGATRVAICAWRDDMPRARLRRTRRFRSGHGHNARCGARDGAHRAALPE